jgi:uncharacterized protein YjiS (DUF1127 family)
MDTILTASSARSVRRTGALGRLIALAAVGRSRRRLGELDDHLLRDLGLTRGQASIEAEKGAWDVPAHWLR